MVKAQELYLITAQLSVQFMFVTPTSHAIYVKHVDCNISVILTNFSLLYSPNEKETRVWNNHFVCVCVGVCVLCPPLIL